MPTGARLKGDTLKLEVYKKKLYNKLIIYVKNLPNKHHMLQECVVNMEGSFLIGINFKK